MLATQTYGTDAALPPVLIVHGLYGSGRNWGVIAKRLSEQRRVVTVDMRNHGASFWEESHSYHDLARDLALVIEGLGGRADVIGHSMGGKGSMVLALDRPELVRRLVVADIAPVAYSHTQAHLIHAMRRLDLSAIETRAQADAALTAAIDERDIRAFLLQSLDVREKRWRLNLDVLERDMGLIIGFPEVTGQFTGPTLFLAGAGSNYVRPEYRARIKALFPKARHAKIPGAGHWLHADKPREFEAAARVFLNA
jgi:esterase